MEKYAAILIGFFGIISIGCSKEDDSPILSIIDIESENSLIEKSPINEAIEYSEFN